MDRLAAAFLLVTLCPLLLSLTVVVALSSRGGVLYWQERVGLHGRVFRIVKFRSMREGAGAEPLHALAQQRLGVAPLLYKPKDDPRVTPVGRFLRRTSCDELPQLFNVLRGEMSLVGPRPGRPAEVARYTARERMRLAVLPGMTGLWQISGRSELAWQEAFELDLKYLRERSAAMDLWILLKTVPAVLGGRGAY